MGADDRPVTIGYLIQQEQSGTHRCTYDKIDLMHCAIPDAACSCGLATRREGARDMEYSRSTLVAMTLQR